MSLLAPPESTYSTKEEMDAHLNIFVHSQGYAVTVKRSEKDKKVIYKCDRGGEYNSTINEVNRKRQTSSRINGCPFELAAYKWKTDGLWHVKVKVANHNHEASENMAGHSKYVRLSDAQRESISTMSQALVDPRQIISALRQENPDQVIRTQTVYNARSKSRNEFLGGRQPVEALISILEEGNYAYKLEQDASRITRRLFFAHPEGLRLFKRYYHVLVIDCTYKTNVYGMPLCNILGMTASNQTFIVAIAFLNNEVEESYNWVLQCLSELLNVGCKVTTIVTDRELALMNAIEFVMPSVQTLLCVWHINKNVVAHFRKWFEGEDFPKVVDRWQNFVSSATEEVFQENVVEMEAMVVIKPQVWPYLQTWLVYKRKFVRCYTKRVVHFG
jgi:hypothetical protein